MSNTIVLDNTGGFDPSQTVSNANAKVAWDNALRRATVTSAVGQSTIPNLYDYTTTHFWTAGSGTVNVDITLNQAEDINCAAIAAGNWFSAGTVIEVYADGNKVGEISGLKDNQPHLFVFDSVFTADLQIRFISTGSLFVGQVLFGKSLDFPKGVNLGLELGQFNNEDQVNGMITEENNFGSSTSVARSRTTVAPFDLIPQAWFRSFWQPFSDSHKGKPIWFGWNTADYPNEIIFGSWKADNINYSRSTFLPITLTVKGVV